MTFDEFTQKLISEIAKELRTKQTCLEFDDVPTANSANPVTSDGIKTYVDNSTINDIRVAEGEFDNTTKKIILTLTNGTVIDFSVADLVSGLQSEIDSSNKLSADLIDDTNSTNKLTTTSEKTAWNNKLDKLVADWADQVYVKKTDGTDSSYYIDFNSTPYSVCIRNASGRLNVVEALYDSQAMNLGQYKNIREKRHQILVYANDGTNTFSALITLFSHESSINTRALLYSYFSDASTGRGFNLPNTTKYVLQDVCVSKLNANEDGIVESSVGLIYDTSTQSFTSPNILSGATFTITGVRSDTVKAA